jgi:hypothetical protein
VVEDTPHFLPRSGLQVLDDDVSGLLLSSASLSLQLGGAEKVVYTVRLKSRPRAPVTVHITPHTDSGVGSSASAVGAGGSRIGNGSVTVPSPFYMSTDCAHFSPSNWSVPVGITLRSTTSAAAAAGWWTLVHRANSSDAQYNCPAAGDGGDASAPSSTTSEACGGVTAAADRGAAASTAVTSLRVELISKFVSTPASPAVPLVSQLNSRWYPWPSPIECREQRYAYVPLV